ncbi:MAG: hypothetical protein IKT93_05030 [Clostridia bacterium]|nr:hypothetical protein [Clostridia bacterium]
MKKYTNKELKNILNDINGGAVYVGIKNGRGIGKIASYKNYIEWSYYGSSCEKKTVENLRWLLENIFSDCDAITPAIYSKYHINYIPVNKQYGGIDLSWMHPNIYNL